MPEGLKGLSRNDWIRVGAAVIFFIASFLPFVGINLGAALGLSTGVDASVTIDAWHSYGLLGVFIVFVAIAVWALRRFTAVTLPTLRVGWEVAIPAAAGIGTALVAIRAITYTGHGVGIRYGAFLLVISGIVFAAMTFDRSRV